MDFLERTSNYLQDKQNLRKVIFASAAIVFLLGVVLFSSDIQRLLNPPDPSAAEEAPTGSDNNWIDLPNINKDRSNAKMIDVYQGGERWVYLIGGTEKIWDDNALDKWYQPNGGYRLSLVPEVERIKIDTDGSPITEELWETTAPLNFGHAEFGLIEYDGYIYVISGDIHAPEVSDEDNEFPLLYSTIERLSLTDTSPTWEVVALISGLNFYPEVKIYDNQLHIVGGVYGNPFRGSTYSTWGNYGAKDPLVLGGDDWDSLKDKPVIGDVPLIIGTGGLGQSIIGINNDNPPPITPIGGTTGIGMVAYIPDLNNGVMIQQIIPSPIRNEIDGLPPWYPEEWSNLNLLLSQLLLNGEFYTTVSEHYILDLTPDGSLTSIADELDSDYESSEPLIENTWTEGRVIKIGHLRLVLAFHWMDALGAIYPTINPAPQGRYGHQLFNHNGDLLVVGGASWSNPYSWGTIWGDTDPGGFWTTSFLFWVIEDDIHPFTLDRTMWGRYDDPYSLYGYDYRYIGNITYRWNTSNQYWQGTNTNLASFPRSSIQLGSRYALYDGLFKKGRAFFGLAELNLSDGTNAFVASAGLENVTYTGSDWFDYLDFYKQISGGPFYSSLFGIPIQITDRVEKLGTAAIGWEQINSENKLPPTYGLTSVGIGNYCSISINGQIEFQLPDQWTNAHVPDYELTSTNYTGMFDNADWYAMPSYNPDNNALENLAYAATFAVRTTDENKVTTIYIYRAGGSSGSLNSLPSTVSKAQVIGPFMYGGVGILNLGNSEFWVEPPEVKADGSEYAIAHGILRDYWNNPIAGQHITITVTSSQYFPHGSGPQPEQVTIEPLDGDPPDDGWIGLWLKSKEDGSVKFKLSSTVASEEGVFAHVDVSDISGVVDLKVFGPLPLTFTLDGVPSVLKSTIEVEPIKVLADGNETSVITVTLVDHNDDPTPGYWMDVASNRNILSDPDNLVDIIILSSQYVDPISDENGQVKFEISSEVGGVAVIRGKYSGSEEGLETNFVNLLDTAYVNFTGFVDALIPDRGKQGQELPNIQAIGKATNWNDDTTVSFIPPAEISFQSLLCDIEDLYIIADGLSITPLEIRVSGYPDTAINLSILEGSGNFWPSGTTNVQVDTDGFGVTEFAYESGDTPGLLKILAEVTNGPSDELWLILEDASIHPYVLEMIVDPPHLASDVQQSTVRASIYRYYNGGKELIEEEIIFYFASDDDGNLNPDQVNSGSDGMPLGVAQTIYTRGNDNGGAHIFAGAIYDSHYLADHVLISKESESKITWDSLEILNTNNLTLGGTLGDDSWVHIDETAKLGFWTFSAATPLFPSGMELVQHPFLVLPHDADLGARLVNIQPKVGLRDNTYTVGIIGEGTHFYQSYFISSVVSFTPVNGSNSSGIEIIDTHVQSSTYLEVDISIKNDALVGYWNIAVTTEDEVATMPGDFDYLVTDESNYVLNIYSNTPELPRDGESQAIITATVSYIDPLTSEVTPQNNVEVVLDKDDDGQLDPLIIHTNKYGIAKSIYTTDSGSENEIVTINATAILEDSIVIGNWVKILKVVYPYEGFILSANPDTLPLYGDPVSSALKAEGLPTGDKIDLIFEFVGIHKGHIQPINTATTTGVGYSTYIAAPESERIPETVEIVAWATIPGIGVVMSNTAIIQIGRDQSDYQLDLTAIPNILPAGGTQTSEITVTLTFDTGAVAGWPISFELAQGQTGDYLKDVLVYTTTPNGQANTEFVPGNIVGAVMVRARPLGLNILDEVVITKNADQDADYNLTTISSVPRYVPADDTAFSVVTVTVHNSNYVPLEGKVISISTDRPAYDTIRLPDGSINNLTTTNNHGRAMFRVSSDEVGHSVITAYVDNFVLFTDIIFEEPGSLVPRILNVIVPFEARDYDNLVWIYLEEQNLADPVFINEVYAKTPRPDNRLTELYEITIYFHPGAQYTIWAKGRNHLGRIREPIIPGSSPTIDEIEIDFTKIIGSRPMGLLVGDFLPNKRDAGTEELPSPFHDNAVNTIDITLLLESFYRNSYLGNINWPLDDIVNTLDLGYMFKNYGPGESGGPPPYDG